MIVLLLLIMASHWFKTMRAKEVEYILYHNYENNNILELLVIGLFISI